jgi:hypothetical membrane protein
MLIFIVLLIAVFVLASSMYKLDPKDPQEDQTSTKIVAGIAMIVILIVILGMFINVVDNDCTIKNFLD